MNSTADSKLVYQKLKENYSDHNVWKQEDFEGEYMSSFIEVKINSALFDIFKMAKRTIFHKKEIT